MAQHILEVYILVGNGGLYDFQRNPELLGSLMKHLLPGAAHIKYIARLPGSDLQGLLINGGLLGRKAIFVVDRLQIRQLGNGLPHGAGIKGFQPSLPEGAHNIFIKHIPVNGGGGLTGGDDQHLGHRVGIRYIRGAAL